MQKYKQQILEPNPCSHHRKTPLLFRPHHSGCQKYRVFLLSKRRIIFRDAKRKRRRRGWGCLCTSARRRKHTEKSIVGQSRRTMRADCFPPTKKLWFLPVQKGKKKQKKTGDDLVPVALKKTGNRSRCERQ